METDDLLPAPPPELDETELAQPPADGSFEMLCGVPYRCDADADPRRHLLDLYLPLSAGRGPRPVLVHVHGGGWIRGDRNIEFYGAPYMCRAAAARGWVAAAVSYRKGDVKHPTSVEDVASALEWVLRNIDSYGGDSARVHLSGHSAGAHLSALLAVHPRFDALSQRVAAVAAISGIYNLRTVFQREGCSCSLRSWFFHRVYVNRTFGSEPDALEEASPGTHVRARKGALSAPPTLVLNASLDLGLEMDGEKFHKALAEANQTSTYVVVNGTNHATVTRCEQTCDLVFDFFARSSRRVETEVA